MYLGGEVLTTMKKTIFFAVLISFLFLPGLIFADAGHGIESPSGWQVSIPPDQSAQLKVYYDPSVHPDLRGPVIREIYIFSNDPVEIEKKVQIELNQIN